MLVRNPVHFLTSLKQKQNNAQSDPLHFLTRLKRKQNYARNCPMKISKFKKTIRNDLYKSTFFYNSEKSILTNIYTAKRFHATLNLKKKLILILEI